jgi:capsular exopolysaccharide synthesis family protein
LPDRVRRGQARPGNSRDRFWRNVLTESIDATRTMVLHSARQDGLRVLMVTSATVGEGKTMLASHLAVSLARTGLRTLLIDSDLRRPSVHRIFNMPLGPGLAELLRGELAPAAAVQTGPVPGLWALAAGRPDAQALLALARGALVPTLQQLRAQFDFIVMDSAPVLPVNDSQMIGQCADSVVLAVREEVSRVSAVRAACERLTHLHIPILGAVVNGARMPAYYTASYYTEEPMGKPAAPAQPAAPAVSENRS